MRAGPENDNQDLLQNCVDSSDEESGEESGEALCAGHPDYPKAVNLERAMFEQHNKIQNGLTALTGLVAVLTFLHERHEYLAHLKLDKTLDAMCAQHEIFNDKFTDIVNDMYDVLGGRLECCAPACLPARIKNLEIVQRRFGPLLKNVSPALEEAKALKTRALELIKQDRLRLETANTDLCDQVKKLKDALAKANGENLTLTETIDPLQRRNTELQKALGRAQQQTRAAKAKVAKQEGKYEQQLVELNGKLSVLEDKLQQAQQNLQCERAAHRQQIQQLREHHTQLVAIQAAGHRQDIERRAMSWEDVHGHELKQVEQLKSGLGSQLRAAQTALEAAKKAIAAHPGVLKALAERIAAAEHRLTQQQSSFEKERKHFQAELGRFRQTNGALNAEVTALRLPSPELLQLKQQRAALNQQLKATQSTLAELQSRFEYIVGCMRNAFTAVPQGNQSIVAPQARLFPPPQAGVGGGVAAVSSPLPSSPVHARKPQ